MDEVEAGGVELVHEGGDVGGVDFLEGDGADDAVVGNVEESLGDDDAPDAAGPDPVDEDICYGLAYYVVGMPAVPVEFAQDVHCVVRCEEADVVNVNPVVAVFVVADFSPGGDGYAHVGWAAMVVGI